MINKILDLEDFQSNTVENVYKSIEKVGWCNYISYKTIDYKFFYLFICYDNKCYVIRKSKNKSCPNYFKNYNEMKPLAIHFLKTFSNKKAFCIFQLINALEEK